MAIALNFDINTLSMGMTKDNCVDQVLNNDFSKIFESKNKDTFNDVSFQKENNAVDESNNKLEIKDDKDVTAKDNTKDKVEELDNRNETKEERKIDKIEKNTKEIDALKNKDKNKKKKEECASSEIFNMIMNLLNSDDIDLKDFFVVDENNQITFNSEKMNEFMMLLGNNYEKESGLNFDEVLTNLTEILSDTNEELNLETESEQLVNVAVNFTFEKVNEEINNGQKLTIGKKVDNEEKEKFDTSRKDLNDELVTQIKDVIKELVHEDKTEKLKGEASKINFNADEKQLLNSENKIENLNDELVNAKTNEETELERMQEQDELLNESIENSNEFMEDKIDNKDVKRININNNNNNNNIGNYSIQNANVRFEDKINEKMAGNIKESINTQFFETVKVVKQTITGINLKISETSQEMELKLDPENLGKISLKVATDNGIVTAKIEAESQRVKEILEANLSLLKESLTNRGMQIENLEVSVSANQNEGSRDYNYERNANQKNNPHKIPRNSINKFVSIVDNSNRRLLRPTTYSVGNNVNYIA